SKLERGLDEIAAEAASLPLRPKVYFEEWDEPIITGIRWVAELVRIAGGDDIFPELAAQPLAKARILASGDPVIGRAPDIILGSWCGKKFRSERVAARPGWDAIPAVRDGELHEIRSPLILQPGPAALTDGVREIAATIRPWAVRRAQDRFSRALEPVDVGGRFRSRPEPLYRGSTSRLKRRISGASVPARRTVTSKASVSGGATRTLPT